MLGFLGLLLIIWVTLIIIGIVIKGLFWLIKRMRWKPALNAFTTTF